MGKAPQTTHQLQSGGYGLGCDAYRTALGRSGTPAEEDAPRREATVKAHGVVVAMPLGQSWTPTPSIGCVVNAGTVRHRPPPVQPARVRAGALPAEGVGRGGGPVVSRGRNDPPRRPGKPATGPRGPASRQRGCWKARRSPVNIDELAFELYRAERRVREIQTKLHRWARDDAHRRFDDLFNLVCDPASPSRPSKASRDHVPGVPDDIVATDLDTKILRPIGDSLHLSGAPSSGSSSHEQTRLSLRQRTFHVHDTHSQRIR